MSCGGSTSPCLTRLMTRIEASLARLSADLGGNAQVVGGAVRDRLLGMSVDEVDIVVDQAEVWARAAAEHLGVRAARIGREPEVWRLVVDGGTVDVVERVGSLRADLMRRDFTVNAMAVGLPAYVAGDLVAVVDPLGGRADLEHRRLRMCSDSAISDDPVRALRGIRLEATRELRMTAETEAAVRAGAQGLEAVAAERVWLELERVLLHERSSSSVRRMEALGLLDVIVPELAVCRGVDQRPVHRRDVLGHQLDALEWIDALISLERPRDAMARELWSALWRSDAFERADELQAELWKRRLVLRVATLLHDLGKPATRRVDPDGRTRFFGHSELGTELVGKRLSALRAPRAVIDPVATLVLHHLRPGQVAAPGRAPTARALHRFHLALGELAAPLCLLFLADSLATVGAEALAPRWPAYVAHVAGIVSGWDRDLGRRVPSRSHVLSGHAIMEATGLRPGPLVGAIRAAVEEAAAVGEIATTEEARALAVRLVRAASRGDTRVAVDCGEGVEDD